MVSVGGQISVGGKAGVGAVLSYVGLDNSTEANIVNTTFDKRADDETDGTSVKAEATNTSDSYNIGAGVSAAGTAAVSGTVVVTQTHGTAGAVMDGVTINNAKTVTANALDDTDILSVIGNATASGKAAVGAGVAYTEIGGVSADKEKAEQHVTAEINNSTINTIDTKANEEKAAVNVTAKDEARVINVAIGIGGATNAAVQGASATTLINKTTSAEIVDTNIDEKGDTSADVTVDAQNDSEITSSASTVAAASQGAGVGAGIAVNRIIQQTNAAVNGGTMDVNNLTVKADATPRIENIGVGGGIAGQGAGISGSVAVNMIENDVTAHIGSGANIEADGSVGVVATSDEQIANYAGQLAVGGIGAGVGVSVSVNQIAGTTSATVGGEKEDATSVVAKGNDSLTTDTVINVDINDDEKSEIHNTLIDDETVAMTKVIDRQNEERSGLIVDASSTRDLKSFLITAGVAGEGAGVTGTVNVNQIAGGTDAGITNTTVNDGNANTADAGNVTINAGDYSNMSGFVGSAAVGGIGAGVGLASDTNTINRKVTASVDKSDIKAQGFEVDADSAQGISSFGVGAGAAGVGGGAAGVVTVTELNNTTKAMLNNSKVNANTVSIKANHTGIVNAGNVSLGGAGLGVGAGLAVGVLKDNSITEVTVKGNDAEEDTITASGDVTIAATNTAVVKPVISANGVGVFGGVAGATSINNLNSTVKTNIEDVGITSTGGSISGTADNTFNVKAYMGTIGGGAVGVGAGVTVNTIDSTVQTNVNGSALDAAKDITLTAQETRNIEQLATNYAAGGAAAGANIAITNVGQAVKNDENSNSKAADKIADANKVYGENNKDANKLLEGAESALKTAVIDSGKATPHVDAELGGGKDSQITVNITNSNIKADNNVTAKATETDNITMTLGSASVAAGAAVNAGVGILNVHRNVGVNITGAEITAEKAVELASVINGSSNLDVYQGTVSILGVNAAYGGATSDGTSGVTISSGTIDGGSINILAEDAGRTDVDAIGIGAGVVSAGAIVAEGTNESQTAVNVSNTTMNSDADIDIKAERQAKDSNGNTTDAEGNKYASLNINAIVGNGGLLGAGAGLGAVAEEKGSVKVNLSGMRNTLTAGEALNINAFNAPVVNVSATSGAGSLIAAASVTYAEANIDMDTEVNVDGYTTLAAGSGENEGINISAEADAAQNVEMEAIGVAIGGAGQANAAEVNITSDVKVDIAGNTAFKANVEKENVDVNIKADNTATQSANAYGLAVGAFFATGTNLAEVNTALKTNVNVGSSDASKIKDMDVEAHSKADTAINSDGSGGGMLDMSPIAAQAANNVDSETKVNITGTWNVAGDMKVEAVHENDIDIIADAVKASVAGYSGVESKNEIKNDTGVTFTGAKVTTGGDQDITARNNIVYNADVTGSGYGGVQGADVYAKDVMELKADVSLDEKTELKAGGLVDINALTTDFTDAGDENSVNGVDKAVTIKSAGLIAGTYAYSDNDIKFTNTIDVDTGSSITTVGTDTDNADITLTAADRTDFTDIVTADTQGGVIGAAGTKLENDIIRTNAITVGGMVDSNYDANFDAGDSSVMNLTLRSNAYNKTAAPLVTDPYISGTMKQYSSIDFEAGSSVKSLRNINAAAGAGDTTIAKESKTWRWVDGGETGTGSIASTSDGTLSGDDAVINTTVTVDGSLEAGKNHQLDITIDYAENGKENLEGAINSYGTALEKEAGEKLVKNNVNNAESDYNTFLKTSGLESYTEELSGLNEKYQNDGIVHKALQGEYEILTKKLQSAKQDRQTASDNLEEAKQNRDNWVTKQYNDYLDNGGVWCDEGTYEIGLNAGTYGEEKQAYYRGLQKVISDYEVQYNNADTKVTDLTKTTEAKEQQVQDYKAVLDTTKGRIDYLNGEISKIKASDAYKDKLADLQKAQQLYNDVISNGVSAESVNEAIFGTEGKYIDVTASKWLGDNKGIASVGMADYAAGLLTRYDELAAMMQDYTGTDVSAAYSAEMNRIQNELRALGIGSIVEQNGKQVFVVAEGASTVPTIELDNLMVSGGNVNISADTLNGEGTGEIIAHGKPSVTITNNTDFFLHVNDVVIDSDGGKVLHNNVAVDKHDKIDITSEPGDSAGNNGQITIQNTTITTAANSNIYTPDIGIYGNVSNPFGNITIKNAHNSIYVAGEVTDSAGNVLEEGGSITGRTINLSAGGSVTQGYSDDIKNISGDPQNAVGDDTISAIQQALIDKLGNKTENGKYYTAFKTPEDLEAFLATVPARDDEGNILKDDQGNTILLTPEKAEEYALRLTGNLNNSEPGISAGGAIYINAASINVNGKIQSGYESYKLNINSDKKIEGKGDILKKLINSYQKPEGEITTDYSKYMTDDYLVTLGESGAVYENGKFVYKIKAWYNPETNEIFTEDIEQAGGGRIYLTGAIANTNSQEGGGKLIVLDGGSNYIINGTVGDETTNNFTFKLGSINAETVNGYIEINDTSSEKTVTTVYTNNIPSDEDDKIAGATYHNVDDKGMEYQPTTGLYYNWSNGEASRVITSYKSVTDTSWFGLDKDSWEQKIGQLSQVEKDSMQDGKQINISGLMDTESSMIAQGQIDTGENGYKYIDVDTSSEKDNTTNNNIYQITFQRQGKPKQGVDKDGKKLYLTKDEDGHDILTIDPKPNDRPYYLKNEDGTYVYEVEVSEPVTTTKKKGLFGLWGKTVTTEWKETSGMITAYNFGLKADNSIGIEFVGNETSTGKITSNSDILLGGDIHMGQVEITSGGSINHVDNATVISDNASFKAETGIDVIVKNEANPSKLNGADTLVLDGEELGNPLHLDATTTSGNINIQAVAANEYKDVYIDDVSTGAGDVTITAEGSLLNGNIGTNGYAVKGDGITLQSYGGGIDLVIDGGTEGTNAYAVDDISLTEATGHMYLGEIVAEDGNVVLKVTSDGAGFVDAIVNNSNDNKDDNRIEEWKKLGLLGDDTKDKTQNNQSNQLTNLENAAKNGSMFMDEEGTVSFELAQEQGAKLVEAGKEFVKQMEGANATVQKAHENLNTAQGKLNEAIADLNDKKDGSEAAYKNALKEYNNAYDAYEQATAYYNQQKDNFIENSGFKDNKQAVNWLTNYEAIGNAEADNYGWTQQQLLYAVQDTVINPNAGSVSDVKTANVTGNNITFISNTGNLGVVDDQASSLSEIGLTPENLADLFTGEKEDATGFLEKLASARAGDVVWGADDVVIRRTTPVSVKLNSDGGTVTVKNSDNKTPTADHIYLLAKDSVLNANEFDANDLRLSGQKGLNVNEVTGSSIYLEGGSGDIGHKVNDALQAVQVTLKDNGFISANAAGNVALQQAAGNNVDFTLGSVAGKNVNITANGDIVSRTDDISYINASETITLTSDGGIGTVKDGEIEGLRIKNSGAVVNTNVQDAIYIEAKQDGTLILGKMEQAAGGVNVDSEGSIYIGKEDDPNTDEKDDVLGYIEAKNDVNLHAAEDIIISGMLHVNKDNGNLNLHADNGDIIQTTETKGDNIVAANVGIAAIGGDVKLDNPYNVIGNVDIIAVGGSLGLTVSNPAGFNVDMGGFTNKQGGDVSFTNNNGSINITTEDIEKPEEQAPANINGSLFVTAKKDKDTDTAENADINNKGILNATGTIEFTAVDGVINSDTVNGKDVIMQAIEQELENILAKDSVTLNGDRIHGQNITQNTEADGDLIINTDSNSGSGPIESLVIDKIDANDKSVFTELWAVEADITTVDDKMDFNDIMIEENAWLENSGTLATIYGNVPVKDDDANVHIYQSYPSMYVNFIDADTVETDGRLLSLDDYWYAYDQRFTAENHLRWQHGRYLDEDWKQAYGYGLSLHNRYGLIDYQEFTETNAGADEVAVEA